MRARRKTVRKSAGTAAVLATLQRFESRNVTYVDPAGGWPMVWVKAKGCHVWDPEGRKYLDLTAAFGVAAAGHNAAAVVQAARRQLGVLTHAMGDVHPHPLKAELVRALSALTFERWRAGTAKTILGSSGFEAVEAALKTARLATGKAGIIAFDGAYHGLGYGALNATARPLFREPFRDQLREFATFVPYPDVEIASSLAETEAALIAVLEGGHIGAILVEPIQARGGIRVPPDAFLPMLRRLCDRFGALLILDEIYTGLGRTGRWFACEHTGAVPDLLCLGKALTGGFPLSACIGKAAIMDAAWPPSEGEAIHTSTFLGHPVGCAMALAQLRDLSRRDLPGRAAREGRALLGALTALAAEMPAGCAIVRGRGLMAGLELRHADGRPDGARAVGVIKRLLAQGYILLPEGPQGEVISLTPPLVISRRDWQRAIGALRRELVPR